MRFDILAFLSGAAVLVIEIVGARQLSPYFGSSVHVWSALIAVTMAALAAGYAWGGRIADKGEPGRAVAAALAGAGLWTLVTPFILRPLLLAAGALGLQFGALAGALVLFGPSLGCLGALQPLVVRLRTRKAAAAGSEMGRFAAVSTVGGVVGALLTGFVFVPSMRLSSIMRMSAFGLLALAALTWWVKPASPSPKR